MASHIFINNEDLEMKMLRIDGSYGEGGGQILRMAIALSAITKKPIEVENIRAGRPNPGLRRQHLTAIESVARICDAKIEGMKISSESIKFYPKKIMGGEYSFDIGTAGSITLVLQACILPSIFAEEKTGIKLTGGTDVKWSPPWDYFENVFIPLLRKMGAKINITLIKRGYYPKGGGKGEVEIDPSKIKPINLGKGCDSIKGIVHLSNLPKNIGERMKKSAERELDKYMKPEIDIEMGKSPSPGVGIVLWAENGTILGSSSLGEKGVPAEKLGMNAARNLIEEMKNGATLDMHAADQLLPYMALVNKGKFLAREVSEHAKTCGWLIEKFLDVDIKISDERGLKRVIVGKGE